MRITISVILPSIQGRQTSLDRCIKAYTDTLRGIRYEILPEFDHKSCGRAWIEGAKRARGDYLHFTADDLVPHPGWWRAAIECVERGVLPAASVLNPADVLNCPVYLEPKLRDVPNILVPFFSRKQFDQGRWLIPIHYGSDDWITYLARMRGMEVELSHEYKFTHEAAEPGRLHNGRATDVPLLCQYMRIYGFVPNVYADVGRQFGWEG